MTEPNSISDSADHPEDIRRSTLFWSIALAFVLAFVIQLLYFQSGFYAFSADESGHVIDAYHWMLDKRPHAEVWLPFYNYVVGTALQIRPDLFLVPRIISFLFGFGALAALIGLAHELFHERRVTAAAAFLAALLPQRLLLSVVPLTEIMFMAAIAAGCLFLLRWIRTQETADLIGAAAGITCASSIRYEGWIFTACLIVYVVRETIRLRQSNPLSAHWVSVGLVLLFPLYWVILQCTGGSRPLAFLTTPGSNYAVVYGNSTAGIVRHSLPVQFLEQNALSWNILGLAGLAGMVRWNRAVRSWLWVPGGAFVIMSALSLSGRALPNHSFWRVAAVWGALLVPFTAYWIVRQRKIAPHLSVLVAVLMLIQFCGQSLAMTSYADFTPAERSAGEYCDTLLTDAGGSRKILVETSTWQYLHVMVASGHPDSFLYNSGRDPSYPSRPVISSSPASEDTLLRDRSFIRERNIGWLVFRSDSLKAAALADSSVRRLRDFGHWTVFGLR